jgi:MoxR-like ATPase
MSDDLSVLASRAENVLNEAQKVVVGQRHALESMLIALLAQGHALLEGVPGTAKTLMVRALSASLGLTTGRIQFTPDLMPSDVVGTHVFDMSSGQFHLRRGPIFTELLLADEINRAPAKTQSALLEAMQERQVSIDGSEHSLPEAFTVFATQNPIDHEGTYPLPEAELDRFLMKVRVDYPSEQEEDEILRRAHASVTSTVPSAAGVTQVLGREELSALRALGEKVRVDDGVRRYALAIIRETRRSPQVLRGAGPRAGLHLLVASRWAALLSGRAFVTPDDVRRMLPDVIAHRLALTPDAELSGLDAAEVLDGLCERIEVPR